MEIEKSHMLLNVAMLLSGSGPIATVILIKWKRGTFDYGMISAENIYV